jgi:hypothetical protein
MPGSTTMNILRTTFGLSLTTAGLLLACGHEGPPAKGTESQTSVTGSQSYDSAIVDRLATARCDREQECKNVGPGEKFASRAVCMDQLRGKMANDLNPHDCPRGLDREAIDRCMAAIKGEECGHPFDTLKRYQNCRTGALCMD